MCGGIEDEGLKAMAAWRRAIELSLGDADVERLRSIAQSRTEPASRVERARILLAYREDPSFFAVGRALGLHHQTAGLTWPQLNKRIVFGTRSAILKFESYQAALSSL